MRVFDQCLVDNWQHYVPGVVMFGFECAGIVHLLLHNFGVIYEFGAQRRFIPSPNLFNIVHLHGSHSIIVALIFVRQFVRRPISD